MLTKQRIIGRGVLVLALILLLIAASMLAVGAGKVAAAGELLRYGSRGESVRQVQSRLNKLGYWCGTADGIFGVNTRSAVRRFQSAKGLSVDGIVGPKTYSALGISPSSSSSSGGYSSSDLYLLARCVYGESRGEPYVGQVAVAAVVLNRVKSAAFPNSISGVIYQPYAFTCVSDGQLYLEPDQSAYNAARDAMNGWDPTNGCLYYYNPATATSAWIWSRPIMLQIGRHNFCK